MAALVVLSTAAAACSGRADEHTPATRSPVPAGSVASDTVPVLKVTDGDTFHVRFRGQDERVRLIGVDTPEVDWYGGDAECYGVQAGLYARHRLTGATVRLDFDVETRDRYGRLLAYVFVRDEFFNATLVTLGYATADPVEPDTRRAAQLSQAESEAREAGRGLWGACPV
jgi:micrococcal nuclease